MNLFNELLQVVDHLKSHRYLLIGGLAYSIYAQPRFTQDIDFLISEKEFDEIFLSLLEAGFINKRNIIQFQKAKIARCVKMEESEAIIVDFLLESQTEFDALFEKKNVMDYHDIAINVIDLESLIALKLERNSKQDQLDVEELKRSNSML